MFKKFTYTNDQVSIQRYPKGKYMSNREYAIYTDTNRVKGIAFTSISTPSEAVTGLEEGFSISRQENLANPLVQYRAILERSSESQLLDLLEQRNNNLPSWCHARLNARIPFGHMVGDYGLYYLSIESPGRGQYGNSVDQLQITHQQALERARRMLIVPRNPGYIIQALNLRDGTAFDEDGNQTDPLFDQSNRDQLVQSMIKANKKSFDYSHDPNQRTPQGLIEIINNNPILVAVPVENPNTVASVGIVERDSRFTYGDIALVEPTYYTDPDHERRRLSARIRRLTNLLVRNDEFNSYYDAKGTLVFNESIRASSFILSLRSGSKLGGDADSPMINGDLGRAYTYIGPAKPETGLMPLGLSYYHNLYRYYGDPGRC